MVLSRSNRDDVAQGWREIGRTVEGAPPANDPAVTLECERMLLSCGNRHHVTQAKWRTIRPETAPRKHRAVASQRQSVSGCGSNGRHISQRGRCHCLTIILVSPANHRAVAPERQTVRPTRSVRDAVA